MKTIRKNKFQAIKYDRYLNAPDRKNALLGLKNHFFCFLCGRKVNTLYDDKWCHRCTHKDKEVQEE